MLKISFFLISLLMFANTSSAHPKRPKTMQKKVCANIQCHGIPQDCQFIELEKIPKCPGVSEIGDNACRKFIYCGIKNGKCLLIKEPKANECLNCYQTCRASSQGNWGKWEKCYQECARKAGFEGYRY